MHSTTPGMDSRTPRSTASLLPVMPIAVRPAPGMGCAFRPSDSILSQTERTSASVAWEFMTTSMAMSLRARGFQCSRKGRGGANRAASGHRGTQRKAASSDQGAPTEQGASKLRKNQAVEQSENGVAAKKQQAQPGAGKKMRLRLQKARPEIGK